MYIFFNRVLYLEKSFQFQTTLFYNEQFLKNTVNLLADKLNYHVNNTITTYQGIEDRLEKGKISQDHNLNSLKNIGTKDALNQLIKLAERSEKNVNVCEMSFNKSLTAVHAQAKNEILVCFNSFLNTVRLTMNEINNVRIKSTYLYL